MQVNTFQCILATDGSSSYAIFLYADGGLQWTSSDRNGGINGLGGSPTRAGYDAGDGLRNFELPQSGTPDILMLSNLSNINVPGVFVFRIGQANITEGMGECTDPC